MSNIAGCPGINTETSGKEAACAGCPNQSLCSSKEFKPDTVGNEQVSKRLNNIKFKLIILSGKGGVGKSTVTTLLARTLANRQTNENFGILDLDICGPSQPKMLGVEDEQVHHSGSGWSPVNVDDNLCVMSIGFLLPSADNAVIWRGPKKNGMVKQFLSEVDWGDLNCLLFDTPPGTSDEHLSVFSYLAETGGKTAALIVTTPQEISLLDVRKEIMFCRKLNIDIVGVIENMSLFECGHCGKTSSIFPAKSDNVKSMCKEMNVNYLGNIPLHPLIGQGCDQGVDTTKLSEPLLEALDQICNNINLYFMNDSG